MQKLAVIILGLTLGLSASPLALAKHLVEPDLGYLYAYPTNSRKDINYRQPLEPRDSVRRLISYDTYMRKLAQRIQRGLETSAIKSEVLMHLQFDLHADGTISNTTVTTVGITDDLKQQVLEAIKSAAPFDALPLAAPEAVKLEFWLDTRKYARFAQYSDVVVTYPQPRLLIKTHPAAARQESSRFDPLKTIDTSTYLQEVLTAIKKRWKPQEAANVAQESVSFQINLDGTISNLYSFVTGNGEADRAALKAVKEAAADFPILKEAKARFFITVAMLNADVENNIKLVSSRIDAGIRPDEATPIASEKLAPLWLQLTSNQPSFNTVLALNLDENGFFGHEPYRPDIVIYRSSGSSDVDQKIANFLKQAEPFDVSRFDRTGYYLVSINGDKKVGHISQIPTIDWYRYYMALENKLTRRWFPEISDERCNTTIACEIDRKGRLLDAHIESTTGSGDIAQTALNAVKNTEPFPDLPDDAPDKTECEIILEPPSKNLPSSDAIRRKLASLGKVHRNFDKNEASMQKLEYKNHQYIGDNKRRLKNYRAALDEYQEAALIYECAEIEFKIGRTHRAAGNLNLAKEAIERAKSICPDLPDLETVKDYNDCEPEWVASLDNPKGPGTETPERLIAYAKYQMYLGDYEGAGKTLQVAITRSKLATNLEAQKLVAFLPAAKAMANAFHLENVAADKLAHRDLMQALSNLMQSQELASRYNTKVQSRIITKIGDLYIELRDILSARQAYKRAIALDSKNAQAVAKLKACSSHANHKQSPSTTSVRQTSP